MKQERATLCSTPNWCLPNNTATSIDWGQQQPIFHPHNLLRPLAFNGHTQIQGLVAFPLPPGQHPDPSITHDTQTSILSPALPHALVPNGKKPTQAGRELSNATVNHPFPGKTEDQDCRHTLKHIYSSV